MGQFSGGSSFMDLVPESPKALKVLEAGSQEGGVEGVPRKMYTPARTALQNPYPQWHKNVRNRILTSTKFGPKCIPLLAQIHKRVPSVAQMLFKSGLLLAPMPT